MIEEEKQKNNDQNKLWIQNSQYEKILTSFSGLAINSSIFATAILQRTQVSELPMVSEIVELTADSAAFHKLKLMFPKNSTEYRKIVTSDYIGVSFQICDWAQMLQRLAINMLLFANHLWNLFFSDQIYQQLSKE